MYKLSFGDNILFFSFLVYSRSTFIGIVLLPQTIVNSTTATMDLGRNLLLMANIFRPN